MRAYDNIRFIEGPDVADIKEQGRKTCIGRVLRGQAVSRWANNIVAHADGTPGRRIVKVVRNDRPEGKAAVRRSLKRRDRNITARFDRHAEA